MGKTEYGYASGRIKALERTFLSQAQVERLLAAKDAPEAYKVLQDTFLSPYLASQDRATLAETFERVVDDAKHLITSVAPDPELFDILWLKYDFYNASTIVKGLRAELSEEEIKRACFNSGKYTPDALYRSITEHTLRNLNIALAGAVAQAEQQKEVFEIDVVMNKAYFATIRALAETKKDKTVSEYVSLLVDLFNLKSALRHITLKEREVPRLYISGGRFREDELAEKGQIVECFARIGGNARWQDALRAYETTHDHTLIERVSDEIAAAFWRDRSVLEFFSPAPLFSYFNTKKHNVQLVNAILTEKETGLAEQEIRHAYRSIPA